MNHNPLISLEAATRFELVNSGFAELRSPANLLKLLIANCRKVLHLSIILHPIRTQLQGFAVW